MSRKNSAGERRYRQLRRRAPRSFAQQADHGEAGLCDGGFVRAFVRPRGAEGRSPHRARYEERPTERLLPVSALAFVLVFAGFSEIVRSGSCVTRSSSYCGFGADDRRAPGREIAP